MTRKHQSAFHKAAASLLDSIARRVDSYQRSDQSLPSITYEADTVAGPIRLTLQGVDTGKARKGELLGTVFGRFENPQLATEWVDCNPFSGKWNFHFSSSDPLEAVYTLQHWLKLLNTAR